ncbi:MAG: hypothetical protein KC933_00745 [Myxococcales bacterium]|nr:hypothetical protein [Myxococcales bacterium]
MSFSRLLAASGVLLLGLSGCGGDDDGLLSQSVQACNLDPELPPAEPGGPGYYALPFLAVNGEYVGTVAVWNSGQTFHMRIMANEGWGVKVIKGVVGDIPVNRQGNPRLGFFPISQQFSSPVARADIVLDLRDDLGFAWGMTSLADRIQDVAVRITVKRVDPETGRVMRGWNPAYTAWAVGPWTFPMGEAWHFKYLLTHPKRGQFIDAPVHGLTFATPTNEGVTGVDGGFAWFPSEQITFTVGDVYLGTALASERVSPMDFYLSDDMSDPRVVNVARLLQSLDSDGLHNDGQIAIYPEVAACFTSVVSSASLPALDFANDAQITDLIDQTVATCNGAGGAVLTAVTAAEAQDHLEESLSASGIFRKNVSKDADYGADKLKLDIASVYFPGKRSNGDPSLCADGTPGVPYQEWRSSTGLECDPRTESDCAVTELECREVIKPIVATYLQQVDLSQATTAFWPGRFAYDTFTAISRDDGATWKRTNVSRMADLSSFELETGEPFTGFAQSPAMAVQDNKILVAWVSTYCRGGRPRYAIVDCTVDPDPECVDDYLFDNTYYGEDIWGVRGPQLSVDYDEVDDVETLGIGEIPFSCLWTARGTLVTAKDLAEGKFTSLDDPLTAEIETPEVGDVVWFKPERLTSGRRDANIPVIAATRGGGFAIAWQEDPEGLRPGKGKGPGQGWSGAISNHKTDIWYAFVTMDDFDVVDPNFIPGGTPDEDRPGLGRPRAMVPFSLPVRVSDNNMVNVDTLKVHTSSDGLPLVVDGTFVPLDSVDVENGNAIGTRRYAYMAKTDPRYEYAWPTLDLCDTTGANTMTTLLPDATQPRWYEFTNTEGSTKQVCISGDGRLLDGDVSASRPNLSLQPYTRPDGTKSAYALLAYEETKGLGEAHADDSGGEQVPKPIKQDYGKDVIYHSFDFTQPDLVSAGKKVNLPATCGGLYVNYCEDTSNPTCTCTPGTPIQVYFDDAEGNPDTTAFMKYRTEVARRVRFIAQSTTRFGATRTAAVVIYKQGQEGQGRPADVFIRRIVSPPGDTGNPYRFENFVCGQFLDEVFPGLPGYNFNVWGQPTGERLCWSGGVNPTTGDRGHINLTSATVDLSVDAGPDDVTPDDPTDDIYGTDKVLLWSQTEANLSDESFVNRFSNSKSHRGFIRSDFLVAAFAFSPNWAAARNGRDRYNFYIRRSFDGGVTWTTDPLGAGAEFCPEYRTDPDTQLPPVGFDPTCVAIPAGAFEPARSISELTNNKETTSDPRVGATPPVPPLDGRQPNLPVLRFIEDDYDDAVFFVAWGTGDNLKSTGGETDTPEAPPLDLYYTRSADYGDTYLKVPWNVNPEGNSDNWEQGELVYRYDWFAHGDPEQGEAQIRATPDGSKMYGIYHQCTPVVEDPDAPLTRWFPWEPEPTVEDDVWFRRVIFW